MKRVLLIVAGALALALAGRALVRALASHETRIRWTIDAMVEGFNDTRMNPILAGLDRAFLDDTWGADRETVRAAAAHLFLSAVDPETKAFLFRAEWTPEEIAVSEGDAPRADVKLDVRFHERKGGVEELAWRVRVEGEMQLDAERRWCFARSRTTTLEGEKPR